MGIIAKSISANTDYSEVIEELRNPTKINMQITKGFTNTHAVTATATDRLEPPATPILASTPIGDPSLNGFVPVENIIGVDANGITQSGYDFEVSKDGEYLADGFGVFNHNQNNTVVGFTFTLERAGVWIFSPRVVRTTMENLGRPTILAGSGLIEQVQAGDKLRLWLAASKTGSAIVDTLSIRLRRIADSL